ncbi:HK97 family phage prohead protease [Bradyrhizobium sp. CCBAU 25338]|uniref:HK97 family phage prohead protease n=1 Tax=Bradyrhizobium sp. CCBAU 25338 TaxID=1641877 RepID=UPI002303AE6E|nr:HK97 family phage prohead protease [Bradyrhizobium sp. CCBAU 25338]MDA9530340.1 peptidase U35 [Bradyrhizobium sp. CCBAU 25338]
MDKIELKATLAVDDAGTITGNAWPFGSADTAGDLITKGAFNVAVSNMPMLFNHNPSDLIGTWDEVKETPDALVVKGQLHMDQPRARAVHGMIKGGLVSGLSIGFRTKAATKQGRGRVISALDLYEVSVVRDPAHPRARITSAKQFDSAAAIASALNRAAAHLKPKE